MSIESILQLDPKVWPLAVMAFLRVVTMLFFLPIFGDENVPPRMRILLALLLTIFLWPSVESQLRSTQEMLQWSPLNLAFATLREVFFGFSVGFSAKMLQQAATFGSHIVGINMGFQTATLFSTATGRQESAFSTLHGLLIVVLILVLNVHHVFLEGIAQSLIKVPLALSFNPVSVAKVATNVVTESFVLAIRIAAPLLAVQILTTLSLGCLARAMPQLNIFILNFPVSFLISLVILFVGAGTLIRFLGTQGMREQISAIENMHKVFSIPNKGVQNP